MKTLELARKHEDYMIAQRRYFHEHPEVTYHEYNTLKQIAGELDAMEIPYVEIENGGILATLKGERDNGKAVLLRCDIDALAITESKNNLKRERICRSKNEGIMHACGHDGHIAMLLGTAKILLDKRLELEGTVYLCFERAEEGGNGHYFILKYIHEHQIKIDTAYATHLYSKLDSGKLAINDGVVMACNMVFHVTIEGKGGHGSRPDLASSPIDAFVAICNALNALRLTKIDPNAVLSYSIGEVTAGSSQNTIPDRLHFKGTMRTLDRDGAGMVFHREFKRIIDQTCRHYGCRPIYTKYTLPALAVINDGTCVNFARCVLGEALGQDTLTTVAPWLASEPFGRYLYLWPGVFTLLGIRNEEDGIGAEHHNAYFDIDESVLAKGAASAATYALEFLKSSLDPSSENPVDKFDSLMTLLNEIYTEVLYETDT